MLPQFSYSSADVKRVRTVRFGILSPEEVVRGLRRAGFRSLPWLRANRAPRVRRPALRPRPAPACARPRLAARSPATLQKAMSVVEVTKPGTYATGGVPIRNGLNDPAMGAADLRSTCGTCKNTYAGSGKVNDCPGASRARAR